MTKRRIKEQITNNSRVLRGNRNDVGLRVWHPIRGRQLAGYRFRRQHPIGYYIADFACIEKKCVIELDGGQHQTDYNEARTLLLQSHGWQVLRFWNNEVLTNLDGVISTIAVALAALPPS